MELTLFRQELNAALIKRGISAETAQRHSDRLCRTFDADDLREIEAMQTSDEIETLADSLAVILNKQAPKPAPVSETTQTTPQRPATSTPAPAKKDEEIEEEFFDAETGGIVTKRGQTTFWILLVATLPLSLPLLAAVFGLLFGIYAVLFALILVFLGAMIAVTASGAVLTLVGIIYGITQLFSFVEAGIFEIGLGVAIAGVTLLLAVLLFNAAMRLVPFLMTKYSVFFRFVCRKLKALFCYLRKECYSL